MEGSLVKWFTSSPQMNPILSWQRPTESNSLTGQRKSGAARAPHRLEKTNMVSVHVAVLQVMFDIIFTVPMRPFLGELLQLEAQFREQAEFAALQSKYGFSDKVGPLGRGTREE